MDLLDNVSQDSIIIICIAMCIIALLLAVIAVYQLIESRRKREKEEEFYEGNYGYSDSNNEVTLNIKPDENIVYADESDETERAKAKEELRRLKEKLLNDEIAKQEENIKSKDINIEKKKVNIEVNKTNNTEITKELVNLPLEVKALENERNKEVETVKEEEKKEEVKSVEPVIVTYEPEIKEEPKEEVVALKVEDNSNKVKDIKDIDAATKEKIIDEYLKQAIIKRIEEEKEKQEELKKKIEQEKNILSFNDSDLEIIDSYLENEENLKEEHNPIEDIEVIEDTFEEEPVAEEENVDSIIIEDNVESVVKDGILDDANVGATVVNTSDDEVTVEETDEDKPSLYEQLKEENAIISYDELLKASKFGYTDEEMDNYVDEKDAIISLDEFEKLYKEVNKIAKNDNSLDLTNIDLNKKEEVETVKIEKPNSTDEVTITKLSDEIKKTNDFLQTLKDLQKNLE